MFILAFETSCDETSVSVLNNNKVCSNIISSQLFHSKYGGVVPELAAREHLKNISLITDEALKKAKSGISKIDLIAATVEPGLIGSLVIGSNFAKAIAMTLKVPFVHVNHIHAHLYSNFLQEQKDEFPFLSLIISGGHTLLVLVKNFFKHEIIGSTVDDAVGESFDKVAKMLELGYPGGPIIDKLSKEGNEKFHKFPKSNVRGSEFDFSFSGIKTSVLYFLKEINFEKNKSNILINDICASFQKTVVEMLFEKTLKAAKKFNTNIISVAGGVSANSKLKEKFNELKNMGYKIYFPSPEFSIDNAAMIGLTGYFKYIHSTERNYFMKDSFKYSPKARLDYKSF